MTTEISITKQMNECGLHLSIATLKLDAHSIETIDDYIQFRQNWKKAHAHIVQFIRQTKSNVLYNQKHYSKLLNGNLPAVNDRDTRLNHNSILRRSQYDLHVIRLEAVNMHKLLAIVKERPRNEQAIHINK